MAVRFDIKHSLTLFLTLFLFACTDVAPELTTEIDGSASTGAGDTGNGSEGSSGNGSNNGGENNGNNGVVPPAASVATQFVILDPVDTTVGFPATVTIQAQDLVGTVVTSYTGDVTLNLTGSATGGGLVNLVNGVATVTIGNSTAETVTLSLNDTSATGLDISSTQDILFGVGVPNAANSTIAGTTPTYADGHNASTITVTIRDQFSNPLQGISPTVTIGGSSNTLSSCTITDVSGVSTCTVTSTLAELKSIDISSPVSVSGSSIDFVPPATYPQAKAVFANKCASCHPGVHAYSVSSYDKIMTKVTPGNLAGSVITSKLHSLSSGNHTGAAPLDDASLATISSWIVSGAAPCNPTTFGCGWEGDVTISSTRNTSSTIPSKTKRVSTTRKVSDISAGGNIATLTLSGGAITSDDFSPDDEVLWIVSGAGPTSTCNQAQGLYGFARIKSTVPTTPTITIDTNGSFLPFLPSSSQLNQATNTSTFCLVQVVRVPQFENLTITGTGSLSANGFDYSTATPGGIIALKIKELLQIDSGGFIDTSGMGLGSNMSQGNSPINIGGATTTANNVSGGGGDNSGTFSGGGGGNAGAGGDGGGPSAGTGGVITDPDNLCTGPCHPRIHSKTFFGSGGGVSGANPIDAGKGGGIVFIFAKNIQGDGVIKAYGDSALHTQKGSGGGAGGSIYIISKTINAPSLILNASGGNGGDGPSSYGGGGGGGGRVHIDHCASPTLPTVDVAPGSGGLNSGSAGFGGMSSSDSSYACSAP